TCWKHSRKRDDPGRDCTDWTGKAQSEADSGATPCRRNTRPTEIPLGNGTLGSLDGRNAGLPRVAVGHAGRASAKPDCRFALLRIGFNELAIALLALALKSKSRVSWFVSF